MEQDQEYEQYLSSLQQDDYNFVQSLLFNYGDAVVPRDHYWFLSDDDDHAWILFIKQGVRLIPRDVYSGGAKGFVFYFKDDMTPRPFQEDCWKVTLANARLKSHYLIEGSPTHTYLRVNIHNDLEDGEIFADDRELPIVKLSWSPALPNQWNLSWLLLLSISLCFMFTFYLKINLT